MTTPKDTDQLSLDRYMERAAHHALLSRDEELALARRARAGDEAAREKLIVSNLRFVVKIAHEYAGYGRNLWELVQEGNLGLVTAADRFEPERGHRFVSYAVWWIRAMILSYVQRSASIVRLGTDRGTRRAFFNLRSARERIEAEKQGEASTAELAAALDVPESSIEATERQVVAGDVTLDTGLIEHLAAASPTPEETVADQEAARRHHVQLQAALRRLDARERTIIERRHLSEKPATLAALGKAFSLSRERARQIETHALSKLRESLAAAA